MAYVDRGGGRESKNHERRVKRGLLAKANPFEKGSGGTPKEALTHSPTPAHIAAPRAPMAVLDCAANLNARALAREHARMLSRAQSEHVDAVVGFTTDFERMGELVACVKAYPGFLYLAAGIHPDNVKRVNEKTILARMSDLRALALTPECVALFAGLDMSRDLSSHYSQQKLLVAQLELAADIQLPVIIQQVAAGERLVEVLTEWLATLVAPAGEDAAGGTDLAPPLSTTAAGATAVTAATPTAAPSDVRSGVVVPLALAGLDTLAADEKTFQALVALGAYFIVDGTITEDGAAADASRAMVPHVPLDRLLLASSAPLHTPQNIPDHFVRTTRNEPSTMPYLLPAVAKLYNEAPAGVASGVKLTASDVATLTYDNSVRFFRFPQPDASLDDAAPTLATPTGADALAVASASGHADAAGDALHTDSGAAEEAAAAPASLELPAAAMNSECAVAAGDTGTADSDMSAFGTPSNVRYLCRTCRATLFEDADVQPHTNLGIRPSARSLTGAAIAGPSTATSKAGAEGGKSKKKLPSAAPAAAPTAASPSPSLGAVPAADVAALDADALHLAAGTSTAGSASITVGADVAVGRWHAAKGKHVAAEGVCRQLLVDYLAWMNIDPAEAEGSLLCPGCQSKVGQYNLGGLKCSCGLLVAPAYKVARNRVDEELVGVDALEAALAAAVVEERALELEDGEAGPERKRNEKRLRVPVSKHRGNFSEFRNKST